MFGIKERDWERIKAVLLSEPAVEKAVLFGSRAQGNYKNGSDIDLALYGRNLAHKSLMRVYDKLSEETPLPYQFDLLLYQEINNIQLKKHIDEKGVCIFERNKEIENR